MKKTIFCVCTLGIFLMFHTRGIFAQSPGGIDSPVLWFQTMPVDDNLKGDYFWQDFSSNALELTHYSLSVSDSVFSHKGVRFFNGHAALPFSPAITFQSPKEVLLTHTALSQATILGVFAPSDNFSSETLLYGLNGRWGHGFWLGSDKIYHSIESGKDAFDYGETEGMDLMHSGSNNESLEQSMRIVSHYYALPPITSIWRESPKSTFIFGNDTLINGQPNINMTSTFDIPGSSNQAFTGYIPEFIAYNRWLSPIERRKVNSYLAIKYGISLQSSYIGSDGQLLWDYHNSAFNNRITALYRDDASGLNQLESSTSYQETHHSYANDFYYNDSIPNNFSQGNPYNRTTSKRFLSIAKQYGEEQMDQSYLFWGDDNQSIFEFNEMDYLFGLKEMERNWQVSTNTGGIYYPQQHWFSYDYDLIVVPDEWTTRIILYDFETFPDESAAFTDTPLSGETGYLCADWNYRGDLYLKFGDNNALLTPNSHDYGYYMQVTNNQGYVYPIVRGTVSSDSVATIALDSRLEVEKDENQVWLRVNGTVLPATIIMIDPQDESESFYGGIGLTKGTYANRVIVREGGFDNAGHRIEVSYDDAYAPGFSINAEEPNSILLLIQKPEYIPEIREACEIDTIRKKVIFNNVFFEDQDVFSFARRESNVYGTYYVEGSSCFDDGYISFDILHGSPPFMYVLSDTASGDTIRTEITGDSDYICDLSPGTYTLQITEGTGYSFTSNTRSDWARTANYLDSGANGSIEWIISGGHYWIGFGVDNNSNHVYGVSVLPGSSMRIDDGISPYPSYPPYPPEFSIVRGDTIKIVKNFNTVTYFINGAVVSSVAIETSDLNSRFYGSIHSIQTGWGSYMFHEIQNVKTEGIPITDHANWDYAESWILRKGYGSSIEYLITVSDDCLYSSSRKVSVVESLPQIEDSQFSVYVQNDNQVTTCLELDQPEAVSLAVYDANGTQVRLIENRIPQKIHENKFFLHESGVYIIKAITATEEFSKKIIIY